MSAASVEPAYPRVAFQGEPGAFGDAMIAERWRGSAEAVPARTFEDALALICAGRVDYAVIPVWNSTIGDLPAQRRALASHAARTRIVEEHVIPVQHCLAALPSASLESIRVVGSHPAALAQCRRFFRARRKLVPRDAYDTAGAARELARVVLVSRWTGEGDGSRTEFGRAADTGEADGSRPIGLHRAVPDERDGARRQWYHCSADTDEPRRPWFEGAAVGAHELAVIASSAAARRYGLVVLAESIQDDPGNATRFVVVRTR